MIRKATDLRRIQATLETVKSRNAAIRRDVIANIITYQSPLGRVTIPEDE